MLRKPRRLMNQINVVPYIDVMLVLLVIFMVTAPLLNPGQIELPTVGSAVSQAVLPIEVTLHADKSITIRDRAEFEDEREILRSDLPRIVNEKQKKAPNQPVVIAADRSLRYEEVINLMDMLREAKVRKIGLLAKSRKG
ncbi:MAG: ExbD/TolR family protein [Pseudomonadota bacterium]|nr:ExbD/TolR family protein [Pseudomonadota bacterium]